MATDYEIIIAQRIRIAELEQQLVDAHRTAAGSHADFTHVRGRVAELLAGQVPDATLQYLSKAHDVVLHDLETLRDQLAAAIHRPPIAVDDRPLPANVRPLRRMGMAVRPRDPVAMARDLLNLDARHDSETIRCAADPDDSKPGDCR